MYKLKVAEVTYTCIDHFSITCFRFYQSLVRNLNFKYKDVHAAAAEVIGMTLKHLSEDDDKVILRRPQYERP